MLNKMAKVVILFILAAAVLSGCGGQNNKSGAEKPGEKSVKQLNVAISGDVNNWDLVKFPDGDARFVWSQIYETLVRLDSDLKEIPGLAVSWEPSDGGRVWTFKLKKGIKFHDGTPFNAGAVKYSYSERADVIKRKMIPITEIQTPDDYTVKFILSRPVPLPSYFTHVAWPVMSPGSVDDKGQFKGPAGTGPYKLAKHLRDQEIVLVRNEDYHAAKGTLDKVVFKVIPDASARVMALQSGQVDMAIKLNESDTGRLMNDPSIKIYRKLSIFTDFMQFNTKKQPLDDVSVRRAIALAVDSEKIVRELLSGIGVPAMGRPLSPAMKYSDKSLQTVPDPQKSRELLAAAGWRDANGDGVVEKNGTLLEIKALLSPWSPREKIEAEALQAQLKSVGIDMKVQLMESGALSAAENHGDFDVLLRSGYLTWGDYPHHLKIHTSKHMYSHWANQQYDNLIMQGESASLDDEAKKKIYRQTQQLIMEEVPAVYLIHEEKVVAARNYVKDYQITAEDPWLNLAGIEIEK
ncbi:MAG: ABC transporter substrate-binding protein [Peptococcaceae bacterium BRH_c4b]|nr:MAG: ABC transporter substrate-binding protein [Peptococcaceae bacterium BRH_c4b]